MVYVLPLPVIVFQLLSLTLGTAIESLIIRYNLGFSRKKSVEYALTLNLYSSIFAWLILFVAQAIAPQTIRLQVISGILFDRFYTQSLLANSTLETFAAAIAFSLICIIELKGFDLIKFLLEASPQPLGDDAAITLVKRLNKALTKSSSRGVSSLFLLGAFTNSVVLLIFFLRVL
ncbi:MAG: hypothetical protein HC838_11945 [Spirulinaceae cyanobacterium RM2_2_10]|nr:hypothetical protein [Spirulinaceae cyanobacterium SM2_1_0]NJO20604.1 hypothetical protein [Spirulinaceae cyanobacterium RM2_2_10]